MQSLLLKINLYLLRKIRFKKWSELEDKKYSCLSAVEDSSPNLPQLLADYLSIALLLPVNYSKVSWKDMIVAFYKVHSVTVLKRKIPLTSYQSDKKETKDAWDYSGRLWFFYCNLIASEYGWSPKTIASMDVEDALALIQEILTSAHLEREFIWSTTTIAYPYNKATKKSNYSPLAKPYWMLGEVKQTKKAPPIPKSLLPVGNIVSMRNETKNIELGTDVETLSASQASD